MVKYNQHMFVMLLGVSRLKNWLTNMLWKKNSGFIILSNKLKHKFKNYNKMCKTKTNRLLPCTPRFVRILIVTYQLWWTHAKLWSIGHLGKWVKNVVGWSAWHVLGGFATSFGRICYNGYELMNNFINISCKRIILHVLISNMCH